MNLAGWDYTGRNIGSDLHCQMRLMMYYLMIPSFTNHRTWGTSLQEDLAPKMGVASSGVVRTVKRICDNFGLINKEAFNSRTEINAENMLTERGKILYHVTNLEYQISQLTDIDEVKKESSIQQIKNLYEEVYCDALRDFYYDNGDGTYLSPLRATLKALQRYERLDKWEWYLLNTFIRHDDNAMEEKEFDVCIEKYRKGEYSFSMENVIEKPKGHQYIPQYFEYAGLVQLTQRPEWSISKSSKHEDVKVDVLSVDFLSRLHGGT